MLFRRLAAIAVLIASAGVSAQSQAPSATFFAPTDMVWGPAPPSVPPGAQSVILYGDPARDGLFAMRLKVPAGFVIPPHVHNGPEIVTVLSGVVRVGLGSTLDRDKARPLPVGSFYSTEAGMHHFLIIDADAVLQVNSKGPWGIEYLDPKDDPRKAKP